jgi:hypothetical protein
MNREDIIRMGREARLAEPYHPMNPWSASQEALERFAALVAAAEREACAKEVENIECWYTERWVVMEVRRQRAEAAAAIRARGVE